MREGTAELPAPERRKLDPEIAAVLRKLIPTDASNPSYAASAPRPP
jgi:hypothetical protein